MKFWIQRSLTWLDFVRFPKSIVLRIGGDNHGSLAELTEYFSDGV